MKTRDAAEGVVGSGRRQVAALNFRASSGKLTAGVIVSRIALPICILTFRLTYIELQLQLCALVFDRDVLTLVGAKITSSDASELRSMFFGPGRATLSE